MPSAVQHIDVLANHQPTGIQHKSNFISLFGGFCCFYCLPTFAFAFWPFVYFYRLMYGDECLESRRELLYVLLITCLDDFVKARTGKHMSAGPPRCDVQWRVARNNKGNGMGCLTSHVLVEYSLPGLHLVAFHTDLKTKENINNGSFLYHWIFNDRSVGLKISKIKSM